MQSSIKRYFNTRPETRPTKFVDFFCGFGGASIGASAAGLEVVLAVDSSNIALATHKKNHPEARHVCAKLPTIEPLPVPDRSAQWHLHGSPPCTIISHAHQQRSHNDRVKSMELVEWFIQYAICSTAITWSMEQVATPLVLSCMRNCKKKFCRDKFDYEVFNFRRLGVPQNRRRLIAGSPEIVARLRRAPVDKKAVCDVIENPRGTHIRGTKSNSLAGPAVTINGKRKLSYIKMSHDECCLPITGHSPCVLATHQLYWATPNTGQKIKRRCLNIDESLRLQCFPHDYKLPCKKLDCYRGIGNALPPTIMQQMLTPT